MALMAVAGIAIASSSIYFVKPWATLRAPAPTTTTIVLPTPRLDLEIRYEFVSAALVWAVVIEGPGYGEHPGSYWLYRSVDAARHWEKQQQGKTAAIWTTESSLRFVDSATGFFASGDPLKFRKTSDGGRHWQTISLPTSGIRGMQFIDPRNGWISAGSQEVRQLFATHDGGATWSAPIELPTDSDVPNFRDTLEGWAGAVASQSPRVYATGDGGATWHSRDLPRPADLPAESVFNARVRVVPGGAVLAMLYGGPNGAPMVPFTYRSVDRGAAWTELGGPGGAFDLVDASAFQDALHWWLISDLHLYKTSDGGDSWTRVEAELPPNMYFLRVLDPRHAWAQMYDEQGSFDLAFTADGGLHWTRLKAPSH